MYVIMHDDHCIAKTDTQEKANELVEEHKKNFAERRKVHELEFGDLGELNTDYQIIEC